MYKPDEIETPLELRCPLCHNLLVTFPIDLEIFLFLAQLEKQKVLDDYLKICRVYLDIFPYFKPKEVKL